MAQDENPFRLCPQVVKDAAKALHVPIPQLVTMAYEEDGDVTASTIHGEQSALNSLAAGKIPTMIQWFIHKHRKELQSAA